VQPPRLVVRAAADVVRRARQADREAWYSLPDPRLVFLGGDEVYEVELAHALRPAGPTPPAEAHLLALERFGRIRSPHSVALALDLAAHGRAKARAAARAWLTAHAAFAAPHLHALADGDSARAAGARAALAAAAG
jgi:hypothetical protein